MLPGFYSFILMVIMGILALFAEVMFETFFGDVLDSFFLHVSHHDAINMGLVRAFLTSLTMFQKNIDVRTITIDADFFSSRTSTRENKQDCKCSVP